MKKLSLFVAALALAFSTQAGSVNGGGDKDKKACAKEGKACCKKEAAAEKKGCCKKDKAAKTEEKK